MEPSFLRNLCHARNGNTTFGTYCTNSNCWPTKNHARRGLSWAFEIISISRKCFTTHLTYLYFSKISMQSNIRVFCRYSTDGSGCLDQQNLALAQKGSIESLLSVCLRSKYCQAPPICQCCFPFLLALLSFFPPSTAFCPHNRPIAQLGHMPMQHRRGRIRDPHSASLSYLIPSGWSKNNIRFCWVGMST